MLRAELATAAAAVAAGPLDALPAAARALDAACRSAFGRGVDAADCVLTAQTRMGERMSVANALRPAMTPERLSKLLSGAPRALRLGAALLQTSDSDVDAAARMSAADGAAADAAAAAAAATADALHACGAVTAALLAAALALAPHADSAAPPPGDEAASGGDGSSEPPQALRATVVLDELLRGGANAMRDTSLVARHVRASPSGAAFLAVLAKWYALPDVLADADSAARELRAGATMVLQTLTAAGDGCALLWHGGAARSVVIERITLTLRAGAEAAARRPLKADEYSPARVGEAAALICNCTAAPEPAAAPSDTSAESQPDDAATATAAGFASLFCAAGMPGALAALLVPRSALLRPRPDDAVALAIVLDALSRLGAHPEPRAALFPPRAAGAPPASSPAASLFVTMAAAAQHHPVAMAADQARESLRALAAAAAADVACTAALEGVLLVQRAPKGSADNGGAGQAMQLAPAVISAATQLSRAVGWDAWAPSYDDASSGGGSGRSSPCEAGLPCSACGAEAPRQGPPFQRCAACRRVAYCGKSCQVGAWGDHKRECRAAQAADAAADGKAPPEKKKSAKK